MASVQDGPGYTGHVNDIDTALIYMQARYYDPSVGRFLSVDPVALKDSGVSNFARYVYGSDNPIRYVDPDGKFPESPFLKITIINQESDRAYNENVVQPAKQAYAAVDRHAEITHTVSGAPPGEPIGLQVTQNLLHPDKISAGPVVMQGAQYAIDVGPKKPFVFHLGNDPAPSPLALVGEVGLGAGLHAATSVKIDSHFNLEVKPKWGVGIGAVEGFKILRSPVEVTPGVDVEKP